MFSAWHTDCRSALSHKSAGCTAPDFTVLCLELDWFAGANLAVRANGRNLLGVELSGADGLSGVAVAKPFA